MGSSTIGVMIIGSKGAVATTLLAARYCSEMKSDLKFELPSSVEPSFRDLPFTQLKDMVFGGWDIVSDTYSEACRSHGVVPPHILPEIAGMLDSTSAFPAVLVEKDETIEKIATQKNRHLRDRDMNYSTQVFTQRPLREMIQSLKYDIEEFRRANSCQKVVIVNLASTEKSPTDDECFQDLEKFEKALNENHPSITTGMIYAYAAIETGCHIVNFTPSTAFDIPALVEFSKKKKVALCGKDGKTGQTLYKTAIAPMLKYRGLKLAGWYSTNILGNRDGEVLNDPEHRKTKIDSKQSVLADIMGYSDFDHQVHIHYYKPRGDSKEAWDNIDFVGWFDTQMQMKIDWLGDDSILAAPLVADLVRWVDFFSEKGEAGVLPQLACYFKDPAGSEEHDYFKQLDLLRNHVSQRYLK